MPYLLRVMLAAIGAVVAFDLLASISSRLLGFPYVWASVGSFALYAGIGAFAVSGSPGGSLGAAVLAAAVAGFADTTIGWGVSWLIGPGRLSGRADLTIARWFRVARVVVLVAIVLGLIGGIVGQQLS